jgi:leucyl aminopeptidase (aminopeptidase T)
MFDEELAKKTRATIEGVEARLPKHTRSLLEQSDVVIWLTQFENPKATLAELGEDVCLFWDRVESVMKGKPVLLVNLLSARSMRMMRIGYENYLEASANGINVDYHRLRRTGTKIFEALNGKESIRVTDSNGTDVTFCIKNRKVGVETGTLEECYSTGRECEVEIPAGEVYVAPLENSACGILVVDEVRDFSVEGLKMRFEKGKIAEFAAEKGASSFRKLLEDARGDKDRIAEFGIGINYGVKPIGFRIFDEKALGTVHLAIGNNVHMGGTNRASIHIDFNLYKPTIEADDNLIMKEGQIMKQFSR